MIICSTCAQEVKWKATVGADGTTHSKWLSLESSKVKGDLLRTLVSHNVCIPRLQRKAAARTRLRTSSSGHAVRRDGRRGRLGSSRRVRLRLMMVMQQAPWWVFPISSCCRNFSHLINGLRVMQQIQWTPYVPLDPPQLSAPCSVSGVAFDSQLVRHTFQPHPVSCWAAADAARLLPAAKSRAKKKAAPAIEADEWQQMSGRLCQGSSWRLQSCIDDTSASCSLLCSQGELKKKVTVFVLTLTSLCFFFHSSRYSLLSRKAQCCFWKC